MKYDCIAVVDCIRGLPRRLGLGFSFVYGANCLLAWIQSSLHEIVGAAFVTGRGEIAKI